MKGMPSRTLRAGLRLGAMTVLALALQGSYCSIQVDNDNDEDKDEGGRTQTILLPLVLDPWGRPCRGPLPVVIPVRGTERAISR